ncbi:hypothetical protein M422DRAFT_268673 [Sphaerobolus stellatus SS14]|uniref:Uncharacterized protein n=1 Tax=Sphaerobolus stellatus (strain SS14) TaxID=990650 RepID=A0A0C9UXR1_SPHS4|nr:hypothetical protein M422DRAFT_268673 [Sphaerobolus stellatus SS14]
METLALAGISHGVAPAMEKAAGILFEFYQSVQNIENYREEGTRLVTQCADLLGVLRDNSAKMVGTDYIKAVDEAERAIERVVRKSKKWRQWGMITSLLRQSDIKKGLQEFKSDLDHCAKRFNMESQMEMVERQREMHQLLGSNHAEIQEKLQRLLESTQDIRALLNQPGSEIRSQMLTIQEAIHSNEVRPEERQTLQQRLLSIHRQTELLPPMIDLTGEIQKLSEHPVNISGGYSDVYQGEWLGAEKVALKLTRGINQTPKAQKRFVKEVGIWRQLQHKNVARLYGIATFGQHVYTVSPWMENHDALTYLQNKPQADCLKLLCEVATGMDFLHRHGVVHGDLRAANILISENEVACITDFGLSVLLEEELDGPSTSTAGENHGSSRWMAPELIEPALIGQESVKPNPSTDIWSYGMLCLEILTGQRPFHDRSRDAQVIQGLVSGVRPTRPSPEITRRGLSNELWELMQLCWHQVPDFRPSMSDIFPTMRIFQTKHLQSRSSFEPGSSQSTIQRGGNSSATPMPIPTGNTLNAPLSYSPLSLTPPSAAREFTPGSSSSASSNIRPSTSGSAVSETRGGFLNTPFNPNERTPLGAQIPSSSKIGRMPTRPATADTISTNGRSALPPKLNLPNTSRYDDDRSDFINLVIAGLTWSDPPDVAAPRSPARTEGSREGNNFRDRNTLHVATPPSPYSSSISEPREPLTPLTQQYSPYPSSLSVVEPHRFMDVNASISFGSDGRIVAGSLQCLVNQLIQDPSDYRKHKEYQEIFLASYQAFTNAEKVFDLLLQAFQRVSAPSHPSLERANVRHSVLTVLKTWLGGQHTLPKDRPLLEKMRSFAQSIQASSSVPAIASLAQDVSKLIDIGMTSAFETTRLRSSSLASSTASSARAPEPSSRQLAEIITSLESERFQHIIPSDCISWLKGAKDKNGVSQFIDENNKLSYWVQKSILKPDDVLKRMENVKFFLGMAQECIGLGNFSSACAIFAGVASPLITCLMRTGRLDKSTEKKSSSMEKLMSIEGNFQAYRKALKASEGPILPWLRVHLHDLKTIYDNRKKPEGDIINFDVYYQLNDRIKWLLNYGRFELRQPSLDMATGEARGFIENQLRTLRVDSALRDRLQKRSKELESVEMNDYHSHAQELRMAGFTR